jgi:hypothetical protein
MHLYVHGVGQVLLVYLEMDFKIVFKWLSFLCITIWIHPVLHGLKYVYSQSKIVYTYLYLFT